MSENQKTQFRVIEHGPLEVTGKFIIKGTDGKKLEISSPAFLCRCGHSSSKPFCDGTHSLCG